MKTNPAYQFPDQPDFDDYEHDDAPLSVFLREDYPEQERSGYQEWLASGSVPFIGDPCENGGQA